VIKTYHPCKTKGKNMFMKKIWIGINSVKNKFTLQNVSSLPVGSLLTNWSPKRKHGPLPSHIGFSPPSLSLSQKQVYPPKRFFLARGFITDWSAKTKHGTLHGQI
jgi:hypothetical protein